MKKTMAKTLFCLINKKEKLCKKQNSLELSPNQKRDLDE